MSQFLMRAYCIERLSASRLLASSSSFLGHGCCCCVTRRPGWRLLTASTKHNTHTHTHLLVRWAQPLGWVSSLRAKASAEAGGLPACFCGSVGEDERCPRRRRRRCRRCHAGDSSQSARPLHSPLPHLRAVFVEREGQKARLLPPITISLRGVGPSSRPCRRDRPRAISFEPYIFCLQTVLTYMSDVVTLGTDSPWHAADRLHAYGYTIFRSIYTPLGVLVARRLCYRAAGGVRNRPRALPCLHTTQLAVGHGTRR